jgi:hypothetical protein
MNQDFEIYSIDDHHVYIVLRGKAKGLIHFNDYEMFAAFFERFYSFIEEYEENALVRTAVPS